MALLPKKTYSKHSNEISLLCDKEKENVDPFDKLLSSPLKQEVQFQPLSFWDTKIKHSHPKIKLGKSKCGLYESSDSDELDSPYHRKRKCNSKNSVTKARTLWCDSASHKLSVRRNNNYSTSNSFIKKTKTGKSAHNENKSFLSAEFPKKNGGLHLNKTLYSNNNLEETLMVPHKNSNNLKFLNKRPQETYKADYCKFSIGNSDNSLYSFKCDQDNNNNNLSKVYESPKFKIYGNENVNATLIQERNFIDGEVIYKENCVNNTVSFVESTKKTLTPQQEDREIFKFINIKRCFNYPNYFNMSDNNFNSLSNTVESEKTDRSTSQYWSDSKSFSTTCVNSKILEDINVHAGFKRDIGNKTSACNEEDSIDSSGCYYEKMDRILFAKNPATPESEKCHDENTLSGSFDFACFNNAELKDLILKLLEEQNSNITENDATGDSSSTLEDTFSKSKDEDTVIKVSQKSKRSSAFTGFDLEKDITKFHFPSVAVSQLTMEISDLTISNTKSCGILKPETEKLRVLQSDENYKGQEKDSFLIDLRNVTTKRRGHLNDKCEKNLSCAHDLPSAEFNETHKTCESEKEPKSEQSFEVSRIANRISLDWNKSTFFSNPIFESTRIIDMEVTDQKIPEKNKMGSILDETGSHQKLFLKPGKKWFRSMSVLKQLQNGSIIEGRLESTKITGRNFESFVQDMLEMQNDKSGFFTSLANITNKTFTPFSTCLSGYQTILECDSLPEKKSDNLNGNGTIFSKNVSSTILEKSLLARTVKVTQPSELPSAFRSAIGLEIYNSDIRDDSMHKENSTSARDFILMQCGQEDVLSFEEHFNESTLGSCKKIGEGVYGEVFMSSDSVIKIIPIEGSEKVNGEPQKTFEEIISEVLIASKLSDLRKGEKHRTDCFSEMKRCWCVKGKYPKYLLKLWNDYDQQGSGSENDSPVMFKDDQMYIILELMNGGKDLESFVFSSSVQSLSIFIQATFGLAAAEKAFEFEHRDLHWGNVLISETQKKFTTVVLDGIDYKIPTKGVKICIIDFTLSRINHEDCCIFNDLSVDPGLFVSEGDYQFEIYRMMLAEVENDWSLFRPKTNLFWLHYILDKMIKMVRYKNKKSKTHTKHLKDLKTLESVILDHKDSTNFLLSDSLRNIVNKL